MSRHASGITAIIGAWPYAETLAAGEKYIQTQSQAKEHISLWPLLFSILHNNNTICTLISFKIAKNVYLYKIERVANYIFVQITGTKKCAVQILLEIYCYVANS